MILDITEFKNKKVKKGTTPVHALLRSEGTCGYRKPVAPQNHHTGRKDWYFKRVNNRPPPL